MKAYARLKEQPIAFLENRDVYELNELVKVSDPRIAFEGTIVQSK